MRAMVVAGALLGFLAFTGFDCINDPFTLAVNVDPIPFHFAVPVGSTTPSDKEVVDLQNYVDDDYVDDLISGAVNDIGIRVVGAHTGRSVSGSVTVGNGTTATTPLVTIPAGRSWNDYLTERRVATSPSYLTANSAGLDTLVAALKKRPLGFVTVQYAVTLGSASVAGDSVIITIYSQAGAGIHP